MPERQFLVNLVAVAAAVAGFVLATIAMPIVICGSMPHLQRLSRSSPDKRADEPGAAPAKEAYL